MALPSRADLVANNQATQTTVNPSQVNTTQNTQQGNMSSQDLAILNGLISSLASGTQTGASKQAASISQQQQALQQLLQAFTPQAALADATGAVNKIIAQTYDKLLPQLTASINAAGTSAGGTQAGIAEKIQSDATLNAGAQQSQMLQTYAPVIAGLMGQLTTLAQTQDPALKALIDSLNVAKGSQSNVSQSATRTDTGSTTTVAKVPNPNAPVSPVGNIQLTAPTTTSTLSSLAGGNSALGNLAALTSALTSSMTTPSKKTKQEVSNQGV